MLKIINPQEHIQLVHIYLTKGRYSWANDATGYGTTPEQQFLRNMLFKSSTITPHALGYDPREEEMINLTRQYYAQLGEDIDRDKFATGTGNRGIDEQQYLDAVAGQKSEELKAIMQAIAKKEN